MANLVIHTRTGRKFIALKANLSCGGTCGFDSFLDKLIDFIRCDSRNDNLS